MKLRAVTREQKSRDLILVGLKLWLLVHFLYLLINLVLNAEVLFILLYFSFGGKQWQTTPKNLLRMQHTRAIPVAWLGSGSCPN